MTTTTSPSEVSERPEAGHPASAGGRAADHKTVGTMFIGFALVFLVVAGVLGLVMRAQLTSHDSDLLTGTDYAQLFTLHGVMGVFLFLAPAWAGLATALVPLQIGASRLAFPRLQVFSFWGMVFGAAGIVASPFAPGGKVISGWSLGTPLAEGRLYSGRAVELLIIGLLAVCVSLLLAAVNIIVTIVKFRAPGLTQRRSPVFTWSAMVSGAVMLLALPVLVGALVMLFVDLHYGGHVFNGFTGSRGGNPKLWPKFFWFAAYPLLWALLIPALGALTEVIAVFARRRLFHHGRALGAIGAIGVLAFAGWGSELSNLGTIRYVFAAGALVVLLPVASLMLNWLATLGMALRDARSGKLTAKPDVAAVPMLMAAGAVTVIAVGLVGAAVLAVRAGIATHQTYWEVGTQHTLYFGASAFAFVAALHFWAPKLWGRHLSETLGRIELLLFLAGTQVAFVPMFVLGLQHMPFHLAVYPAGRTWEPANAVSMVGAAILGFGLLVIVVDVVVSVVLKWGKEAAADPWGGHTLEWATASPPPPNNFHAIPEVRSEAPALDLAAAGVAPALAPPAPPELESAPAEPATAGASK